MEAFQKLLRDVDSLLGEDGAYRGIVATVEAFDPRLDPATPLLTLARLRHAALSPDLGIAAILDQFEHLQAEDLAVVDETGRIIGVVTEKYVHRRYIEESEKAQSALFGE